MDVKSEGDRLCKNGEKEIISRFKTEYRDQDFPRDRSPVGHEPAVDNVRIRNTQTRFPV
jgi:hypothetical protein